MNEKNRVPHYIHNIDVIRFIMAVWIFIFHFNNRWDLNLPHSVVSFLNQAPISMTIFFIISGFSLAQSKDSSYLQFIKERMQRIYPLYLLVCITGLLIYNLGEGFVERITNFLISVFLAQSWFPFLFRISHHGGTWFLSSLFFLYLLFPFIRRRVSKLYLISKKLFLLSALCLYVISSVPPLIHLLYSVDMTGIYINPMQRVPEFVLGIMLGYTVRFNSIKFKQSRYLPALGVIVLFCAYLILFGAKLTGYVSHNFVVIPVTIAFLSLVVNNSRGPLPTKFARNMGSLTFPLYLSQIVILDALKSNGYITKWMGQNTSVSLLASSIAMVIISFLLASIVQITRVRLEETILNDKLQLLYSKIFGTGNQNGWFFG